MAKQINVKVDLDEVVARMPSISESLDFVSRVMFDKEFIDLNEFDAQVVIDEVEDLY